MIGYDSDGKFTYWNTKRMMDAVFELSTTENSLFLHSPLGDFMQISVYGEIGMTIENNGAYTTTVSFPWVETGDTDKCVVIAYDIDGIDNV